MTIRAALSADYKHLIEIWEKSVRATHDFLPEENIAALKPLILEQYFDAVQLYCYVNEADSPQGFVGVAEGKIEMLFVAPVTFGTGIGKALLSHAIMSLGANRVDVNEQNPGAIGFYQHLGFVEVGRSALDGQGKPFPLIHMALS